MFENGPFSLLNQKKHVSDHVSSDHAIYEIGWLINPLYTMYVATLTLGVSFV